MNEITNKNIGGGVWRISTVQHGHGTVCWYL